MKGENLRIAGLEGDLALVGVDVVPQLERVFVIAPNSPLICIAVMKWTIRDA